jgi:hypothetical protein
MAFAMPGRSEGVTELFERSQQREEKKKKERKMSSHGGKPYHMDMFNCSHVHGCVW